jgi:hypothetical protein
LRLFGYAIKNYYICKNPNKAVMTKFHSTSGSRQKNGWLKPEIALLDIKKDTFAGTGTKLEQKTGSGSPNKKP